MIGGNNPLTWKRLDWLARLSPVRSCIESYGAKRNGMDHNYLVGGYIPLTWNGYRGELRFGEAGFGRLAQEGCGQLCCWWIPLMGQG